VGRARVIPSSTVPVAKFSRYVITDGATKGLRDKRRRWLVICDCAFVMTQPLNVDALRSLIGVLCVRSVSQVNIKTARNHFSQARNLRCGLIRDSASR
jgi:hypothetical protein